MQYIANEKTQELARKALGIQDACNGRAIARFLVETMDFFAEEKSGQEGYGTRIANTNPITLIVLDKLCDLGRKDRNWDPYSFEACQDLADGKDIDYAT